MDLREAINNVEEINDYGLNIKPNRDDDIEDGCLVNGVSCFSFKTDNEDNKKNTRKQSNDQLSELEHQVENAEVRCDTLKQQLEYMRTLYQDRFSQYQTEFEKSNEYEETLLNLNSDISVVKSDLIELLHIEDTSPKMTRDETVSSSIIDSRVDSSCPPISDDDFEECNKVYKDITNETTSPEPPVCENDIKNNCCTSDPDNFQSLVISSPENSFNAVYVNNVNIAPNESVYGSNLLNSKESDKYEKSLIDYIDANSTADEKSLNGYTDPYGTMDSVVDSGTKNGMNPIETIQGILNGITSSVNIISQLSVHASDSGKKKHARKSIQKQGKLSCASKKSILHHFETSQLLPEKQTTRDVPKDNIVQESSFQESKHSTKQKGHHYCHHNHNQHHHHHHHHHTYSWHHNHSHHEDSFSHSNFPMDDQITVQSDSFEELIHDSHHMKQKNRYKKHKRRTEKRSRERSLSQLQKEITQKSSPDVNKNNTKSKSKSRARTDKLLNTARKEISQKDTRSNNSEYAFKDMTQERRMQKNPKNIRSPSPVISTREINDSGNACSYTMMKVHKKDLLKPYLIGETIQNQYDMISSQSASKNIYKIVNNGKNEANKQTLSNVVVKNFDSNSATQGLNRALENEQISSFPFSHYEASPNFSIPTLSSKLKQVEKPLVNLFNFRNIPFVAGTSTTRSHNLALNLQQALSIIKLRSSSLSIGSDLATEVASSIFGPQSRPSTAGSCITHKIYCPVAVAQMKNSKSQIVNNSEYPIYEGRNDKIPFYEGDSATETFDSLSKSEIEAGTFQDTAFPHVMQKENVWEVDQVDDSTKSINGNLRCTCFPMRPCMDYQKLLYEYLSNGNDNQVVQLFLPSNDKKEINPSQNMPRAKNGVTEMSQSQQKFHFVKDIDVSLDGRDQPIYGQIQAHSKELKEVLRNMHRDFIKLNEKYECIHNQIEGPNLNGKKATKELEFLEAELEVKENDIAVILGLHKQLMSLKQQVKTLRMKTNSQIIVARSPVTPSILPREPTVSIRLTRLLRTIQKFQEKLLNE